MNNKQYKHLFCTGLAVIIAGAAVLGYIIGIVAAISWCVCSGILAALFVYDAKKRYEDIEKFAEAEQLTAHANSIKVRFE